MLRIGQRPQLKEKSMLKGLEQERSQNVESVKDSSGSLEFGTLSLTRKERIMVTILRRGEPISRHS